MDGTIPSLMQWLHSEYLISCKDAGFDPQDRRAAVKDFVQFAEASLAANRPSLVEHPASGAVRPVAGAPRAVRPVLALAARVERAGRRESLAHPDWEVKFDADKAGAAASRKAVFGMLAADRIPFIGYHMPFPALGYVEAQGDGFRYVPASYQMMLNG